MDFYVYAVCLAVGLLFTIVSAIVGHIFGGHEGDLGTGGHAEAGFSDSGAPGISFFSPTTIACFITAFGGFGMIFASFKATSHPLVSAPLALVCGLSIAGTVFLIFNRVFHSTQSSSESRVSSLLGKTATIITPIPEKGVGEIAYVDHGSRYSAPAREEHGKAIPNGATVTITRIVGTQFYVTALEN